MIRFLSIVYCLMITLFQNIHAQQQFSAGPAWLKQATFYQLYPQSFKDSDGDGVGDLNGIVQKLDYLQSFGITAIWMNPIFESPFFDAGYDVADYYKIVPRYGNATELKNLHKDVVLKVADYFSQGKYTDYMGALAFKVPYMNVRLNDSKKSTYWVIPLVEYANQQYCRDVFWISTMLQDSIAAQCSKNENDSVNHYAEYPLFIPIWAYRTIKAGGKVDLQKVQAYVDIIETHLKNGYYCSYDENDGRKDFQYWNNCVAFDTADVITSSKARLLAARELGLQTKTLLDPARKNYQNPFNKKLSFLPLSGLNNTILSPDVLTGDLLAQLYFNKPLLNKEDVQRQFNNIAWKAKTSYG